MKLSESIETKRMLVGDGAMGTCLFERGLHASECGALWNVENPDAVADVHAACVRAGADFVTTNTFGANSIVLEMHGLADKAEDVNRAGVHVARRAAGEGVLVFGDVGPSGQLLSPFGDLTEERARAAFARQVAALAEAGADAIIFETFESTAELRAALEGARSCCDLPLLASMRFNREASGRYRTTMGEGPEQLARLASECGCAAVGSNCGEGIEAFVGLLAALSGLCDLPLLAAPNAGRPRLEGGRTIYPESPEFFSRHLPALFDAGARLIGGCCGTTPEHVRAIRAFADSL